MDEVEARAWERIVREQRDRPVIRPATMTRPAHPLVVNYKRSRYGPAHVYKRDLTRPRSLRPPE